MKLMILLGSVRQGRKGEGVANWAKDIVNKKDGITAEVVDVKSLDLPFYDEPGGGPFSLADAGGYTNPKGKAWADKVAGFDAVLIVTPEYNHGYPASLKNALDWVGPEWGGKPVSFLSYGWSASGSRAVEQLRQVVAELGLVQTRFGTYINLATDLDDNGTPQNEKLANSLNSCLDQMIALGKK